MIAENVTVVLRAIGERTQELSYRLLTQQVPIDNIIVIHEHPFVKALDESFEIGLAFNRPWTLCIDADVLLRANAVATLIEQMDKTGAEVFEIQGKVLDKFFGGPMPAGNHLYRTSLLARARQFIPFDNQSARPETYVIKQMEQSGYSWLQTDDILGLHDYEQYYRDIIRTMFVRRHKHARFMAILTPFYQRLSDQEEYRACLLGVQAQFNVHQADLLDAKIYSQWIEPLMQTHKLEERGSLDISQLSKNFVEDTIYNYHAPAEYYQVVQMVQQNASKTTPKSQRLFDRFSKRWAKLLNPPS